MVRRGTRNTQSLRTQGSERIAHTIKGFRKRMPCVTNTQKNKHPAKRKERKNTLLLCSSAHHASQGAWHSGVHCHFASPLLSLSFLFLLFTQSPRWPYLLSTGKGEHTKDNKMDRINKCQFGFEVGQAMCSSYLYIWNMLFKLLGFLIYVINYTLITQKKFHWNIFNYLYLIIRNYLLLNYNFYTISGIVK